MRKIQVRDVPDDVHAVLTRRAASEGRSLQEYLSALLRDHAARPTVHELMERIRQRSGSSATVEDVVAAIHEGRAEQ